MGKRIFHGFLMQLDETLLKLAIGKKVIILVNNILSHIWLGMVGKLYINLHFASSSQHHLMASSHRHKHHQVIQGTMQDHDVAKAND